MTSPPPKDPLVDVLSVFSATAPGSNLPPEEYWRMAIEMMRRQLRGEFETMKRNALGRLRMRCEFDRRDLVRLGEARNALAGLKYLEECIEREARGEDDGE